MGLGATTAQVVHNSKFLQNPHAAAEEAWIKLNRNAAPNGSHHSFIKRTIAKYSLQAL